MPDGHSAVYLGTLHQNCNAPSEYADICCVENNFSLGTRSHISATVCSTQTKILQLHNKSVKNKHCLRRWETNHIKLISQSQLFIYTISEKTCTICYTADTGSHHVLQYSVSLCSNYHSLGILFHNSVIC